MKSTRIQMERGYAETYVTILSTTNLQIETIKKIEAAYHTDAESGIIQQEPTSRTDKATEVEWYKNTSRGVTDRLNYFGWTLKPDWSNGNHNRFERLKKMFPESAFGKTLVAPANFKQTTAANFANGSAFNFVIAEKYGQITEYNDSTKTDRRLFLHFYLRDNGTGFAIETRQDLKNGGEVIFYEFALCAHDWDNGTKVGNCETRYKCEKCGFTSLVDSSG